MTLEPSAARPMRLSPADAAARAVALLAVAWCLFTDQTAGLPRPLAAAANLYRTLLDPWWMEHATVLVSRRDRLFALDLLVRMVVGLGIPAAWCVVQKMPPNQLGWAWPAGARRITAWAVALSVPAGAVLFAGGLRPRLEPAYLMTALGVVPQHLVVFGLGLALLLPPSGLAASAGSLRDLPRAHEWPALLATAFIFGATHLGRPTLLEQLMSFPGGLLTAFATLRARSIWPAVMAHGTLNATVVLLQLVFR